MFKDKKNSEMSLTHAGQETIIAQGVKVEGDFTAEGDVVIDGEVTGSVQTNNALKIGETARIQADVSAKTAIIAGQIEGNINAMEELELLATSEVHGDIQTKRISVAPGARINGRVSMNGTENTKSGKKISASRELKMMEPEEVTVEA